MRGLIERGPFKALGLSFIVPGLGQLYNGQFRKAVLLYLLTWLLMLIFSFSNLPFSFIGAAIFFCGFIGFILYVLFDAFFQARSLKMILARGYNKWYCYLFIFLINNVFLIPLHMSYIYPIKAYSIPSTSMAPGILQGDHIIVDKKYYNREKPKRGDIVVFQNPRDTSKKLLKRIIGLPGDKIEINGRNVFINDQIIEEPYLMTAAKTDTLSRAFHANFQTVTVPDSMIYLLGDNRYYSLDSRFFGFVNIANLKGKALFIYWCENKNRIGNQIN